MAVEVGEFHHPGYLLLPLASLRVFQKLDRRGTILVAFLRLFQNRLEALLENEGQTIGIGFLVLVVTSDNHFGDAGVKDRRRELLESLFSHAVDGEGKLLKSFQGNLFPFLMVLQFLLFLLKLFFFLDKRFEMLLIGFLRDAALYIETSKTALGFLVGLFFSSFSFFSLRWSFSSMAFLESSMKPSTSSWVSPMI